MAIRRQETPTCRTVHVLRSGRDNPFITDWGGHDMADNKADTENTLGIIALLGVVAALAYIFWPINLPNDLSQKLGILRTQKERGEDHARRLQQDFRDGRLDEFRVRVGRESYTRVMSAFNGC